MTIPSAVVRGCTPALIVLAAHLVGCAHEPLPTFKDADAPFVRQRLAEIHGYNTLRASGQVVLSRTGGNSATCDAALVAKGTDRARLRAWKFGQAVLDITLSPEGLWVAHDRAEEGDDSLSGLTAPQFRRAWSLIHGGIFEGSTRLDASGSDTLEIDGFIDDQPVRCTVDAPTLTPRLYEVPAADGTAPQRIELSNYRMVGERPFPHRILATSPQGSILIVLDQVELDIELDEAVFRPPARAVRQP